MIVKDKISGAMVEIFDLGDFIDPSFIGAEGRYHAGEEMPDFRQIEKSNLIFPSNEGLPRCWRDAHFR